MLKRESRRLVGKRGLTSRECGDELRGRLSMLLRRLWGEILSMSVDGLGLV